ncbi:MAG: dTDP-glucose 4,6-dehydratase [Actinomycetota bacterium]
MKLFVTGGAGFIGSNYVRWVLHNRPDAEITNYDLLTYAGNLANLRDLEDDKRYRFVKGDICDPALLDEVVPGHDAILNFAAESHVDRSIDWAAEFVRTNVLGTNTLLDAARRHDIPRYLQVSTDETYGSIDVGSFSEEDRLDPSSPYSASKAGGDLLARAYHRTYGMPVVITRGSNTFGPYQFPEKVIPLFVTNLLEDKTVPLYGDGMNVRDWIYVEDVAAGIHTVLEKGDVGQIYNIAAGNEWTNIDLTKAICDLLWKPHALITPVADRPGHDRRYSVDTSRTNALGWKPRWSFDDALGATVDWYRENRWWWEPLRSREG